MKSSVNKKGIISLPVIFVFILLLSSLVWSQAHIDSIPKLIPYSGPAYVRKPTLQWFSVTPAVSKYYIQIAGDSTFAFPLINVSVEDTVYISDIDLPLGPTFWRVSVDLAKWSPADSFVIVDGRIATLIPQESPTILRKPTLSWFTPPLPVTSFTIQISSYNNFDTLLVNFPTTDTTYTCQADLPIGNLFWRVKSDDVGYSSVDSFEILDARIPILYTFEPKLTNKTQPTLRWQKVPSAQRYFLEIDNTADFSSTIITIPLTDTTFVPFEPLPIGQIYWRVKSDQVALWSTVDQFEIITDTIPFLKRYNGNTIYERKPQFTWHPVEAVQQYRFLLASKGDFANAITIPVEDTTYAVTADLNYGKWYWKVSGSRDFNAFSPVDSLVIDSSTHIRSIYKSPHHTMLIQKTATHLKMQLPFSLSPASKTFVLTMMGKVVSSLKQKDATTLLWDYTNTSGKRVTPGIYLMYIQTKEERIVKRIIVHH